ncbi:MAG: hypothetical protein H7Z40_10660 [Phycisphaerae bacterium]|nr:hypothetical protein [Gemmatimonadaceae bacterium]
MKFCTALLLLIVPVHVGGQHLRVAPAVDVALGLRHGFGGSDISKRGLVSASVLVAVPVRQLARGALVVAGSAGSMA